MDKDPGQLLRARENVMFAHLESTVHLLQGDARCLPLPSASVDSVVTDAPFGQNHSVSGDIMEFYADIFTAMGR